MFAEAFHSTIKGIHLALEVKTFLQQLYACDELQYEIQHIEAWTFH
jgi:hypothetical protein